MDRIFDLCVYVMHELSISFGMTYKEFNVLLFVVTQPLVIITLFIACLHLWHSNTKLKCKHEYTNLSDRSADNSANG